MVKVGCKNAVVAELTQDLNAISSSDGKAKVTYSAPILLPRVQEIGLTPNVQSVDVDADDWTDVISRCAGYNGTIRRDMLSPEEARVLLGEKQVNDMNVATADDEQKYFALGFMAKIKGVNSDKNSYSYFWILKTKFAQSEMTATSAGTNNLTPQADTLSFNSTNRECDNAWRFYAVSNEANFAKTFFTQTTLQTLADAATQTYTNPVSEVIFATELPESGDAGKIYIVSNVSYYWNGQDMVKNGEQTA